MAQEKKERMAGVADGKQLAGTPTGDDVSPEDRVKGLFGDALSEEKYQVSVLLHCYC